MKDRIKDCGTEKRTVGQKKGQWDRKKDIGTEKRTVGQKNGQKEDEKKARRTKDPKN
jgi:hypothetical protein